MPLATTADYRKAQDDLARWLRVNRPTCIPSETARELLSYNQPGHSHLVDVDHEAAKVVFYHCEGRYTIAVRFDDAGLAEDDPKIATFRDGPGIDTWVEKMCYFWGWVHPRYR